MEYILSNKKRYLLFVFSLGLLSLIIIYSLNLNSPPIRSDGLGYYMYLPAILIYQDIGLKKMMNDFSIEYFQGKIPKYTGAILYPETNKYLIKYPIGEAILILPFFILAILFTLIFGLELNGFSFFFQSFAAIAGLCYMILGTMILWRVLEKYFSWKVIMLSTFFMVFATNLFHYATYDSIYSHVFSFFLFSCFLYSIDRLYTLSRRRDFIMAGIVAGMILITRTSNGVFLIYGVLYGIVNIESLKARLKFIIKKYQSFLLAFLFFILALTPQLSYYYLVTGKLFVYSYQEEGFNFTSPEIINVLFSVRKGLFFWAPILLTVFPGIILLKKRVPEMFIPVMVYLLLNIYIISSWWAWSYGGSFGSRPFVESLALFVFFICLVIEYFESKNIFWYKKLFYFFTGLSFINMILYWTRDIPFDGFTLNHYVKFFNKVVGWFI